MPEPLPQQRSGANDIFPAPADGERVEVTPPAFNWLPLPWVDRWRVIVESADGQPVVDERVGRNCLILRRALPAGEYRWDLESPDGRRRGWWRFEILPDAIESVVPSADEVLAALPAGHPRHIFLPEDIGAVVARHGEQLEVLGRNIELAVSRGAPSRPRFHRRDKFCDGRPGYRKRFGDYRDDVDRDLVACALGHLLLRDSRAADHARAVLLEICDWNPEGPCSVDGAWGDEIGLSNARCLFAVYDWTYDLFDADERRYIEATLVQYARQTLGRLQRLDYLSHPGSSHAGRLPGYLGQAALVLHGHADAAEVRQWLAYALDVFGSMFPFYGGRDGGWAEGVFYGSSYTKWYLPFFLALQRVSGFSFLEHRPFYWRLSQYFLHFAPPGWEIHPFGDGYWCLPDDVEWPGFFAQDPFGVYAELFGPPLARQFSRQLSRREIFKLHLLDVFRPPLKSRLADAAGPAENCRAFREAGFVSIHSEIADPSADTAVLARASRYGAGSHRHADQGNFAVISRGRGLISPSGYFGQGYGTDHHLTWTRQTRAHNCLLVDGQGQPDRSHLAVGRVAGLRDAGAWAAAELELSAAYAALSRYRRWIVMLRPDVIVVADELAADQPVEIAWLAHTLSRPTIAGSAVRVERDPASMRMELFAPAGPLAPTLADRFPEDGKESFAGEMTGLRLPQQFHLTWTIPPSPGHRVAAVIAVNGASPAVNLDAGRLRIVHGRVEMAVGLSPDGPLLEVDGQAIVTLA